MTDWTRLEHLSVCSVRFGGRAVLFAEPTECNVQTSWYIVLFAACAVCSPWTIEQNVQCTGYAALSGDDPLNVES